MEQDKLVLHNANRIKSNKWLLLLLTILVAVTSYFLPRHQPYFFSFEHTHADLRTAIFSERPDTVYDSIVFVKITEADLENMTYRSPIDRAWLANLISTIDLQKPSVIAIDIQFDKRTESAKDQQLVDVIKAANSPVVIAAIDSRGGLTPDQKAYHQAFVKKSGAEFGFVNIAADEDDVVRELPTSIEALYPHSFADVIVGIVKGDIPSKPRFDERISWLRDLDDKTPVFAGKAAGSVMTKPEVFNLKNKAVLVGVDLPLTDKHHTPFSELDRKHKGTAGALIHAQMIAQKLDGRHMRMLPRPLEFFLYFIAAIVGFLISANGSSLSHKAKIISILSMMALLIDFLFFRFLSILVPTAMILFALVFAISIPLFLAKFMSSMKRLKYTIGAKE